MATNPPTSWVASAPAQLPWARRAGGFRVFWAARAISQLGDEMSVIALPWLVAQATGSPLMVGLLGAMAVVPSLILGLPLGAVADRRSRRRSMIESDLARLVLVGSIPLMVVLSASPNVVAIAVAVLGISAFRILFDASSGAALPDLVPEGQLVRANAKLGVTEGAAAVAGPVIAGVLIASAGAAGAIAVDAATFGVSAALIALVAMPRERFARTGECMRTSIRAGLAVVRRTAHLRALIATAGIVNFAGGMAVAVSVVLLQHTLGLHGWQAGLVYAANGCGGLCGSVVAVRLAGRVGMGRTVLVGVGSTAVGLAVLACASTATWFWTATAGHVLLGAGAALAVIAGAALRQTASPPALLGRVTSVYRMVLGVAVAVGSLIGGVVGQLVGVRAALGVAAIVMAVALAGAMRSCLAGADPA